MSESKKSFHVRINYKSGNSVEAWFDELDIKHKDGVVHSVSYTTSAGKYKPLFLGISDIESIHQLDWVDTNDG